MCANVSNSLLFPVVLALADATADAELLCASTLEKWLVEQPRSPGALGSSEVRAWYLPGLVFPSSNSISVLVSGRGGNRF